MCIRDSVYIAGIWYILCISTVLLQILMCITTTWGRVRIYISSVQELLIGRNALNIKVVWYVIVYLCRCFLVWDHKALKSSLWLPAFPQLLLLLLDHTLTMMSINVTDFSEHWHEPLHSCQDNYSNYHTWQLSDLTWNIVALYSRPQPRFTLKSGHHSTCSHWYYLWSSPRHSRWTTSYTTSAWPSWW